MAQQNKSLTFKNATIEVEKSVYTITEYSKDDIKVYKLSDILKDWIGVDGVTISFKQVDEVEPSDEDDGEDE